MLAKEFHTVFGISRIRVEPDARQSLSFMLEEAELTLSRYCRCGLSSQPCRLLREIDEREKAISFLLHLILFGGNRVYIYLADRRSTIPSNSVRLDAFGDNHGSVGDQR
jgi:hypothetical protein